MCKSEGQSFFFFFLFFKAAPVAYGSSQARGLIGATGADLHQSSRQRQILNPLSEARDRTRNLMVPSWIRFRCATTGTLGKSCGVPTSSPECTRGRERPLHSPKSGEGPPRLSPPRLPVGGLLCSTVYVIPSFYLLVDTGCLPRDSPLTACHDRKSLLILSPKTCLAGVGALALWSTPQDLA